MNPCIDPGEAVIVPGEVRCTWPGSQCVPPLLAVSFLPDYALCTSQAASLPLSSDLNPVIYPYALSI